MQRGCKIKNEEEGVESKGKNAEAKTLALSFLNTLWSLPDLRMYGCGSYGII
jgi:hypothetical protein